MPVSRSSLLLTALAATLASASAADAQFTPRRGPDTPPRRPGTATTPRDTARRAPPRRTTPAAGRDTANARTSLEGVVYDSIAGAPLAGATVQVVSETDRTAAHAATADTAGRWRVPELAPGRYLVGFFHPVLDILSIEPPLHLVDLPPGGLGEPIALGTPSGREMFSTLCKRPPGDSTGALFGIVRDANSGDAVQGAKVVVTWSELMVLGTALRRQHRRVPVQTTNGTFLACGLPTDGDVVVSAEAKGWNGGQIEVRVPARRILRRDFSLADSAAAVTVSVPDSGGLPPRRVARGTARLTGLVRAPDGRPLSNAQVLVHGTDVVGRSDQRGQFALGGLPAGTYSVEARAIGFLPRRAPVDLASGRAATVQLTMDERGTVLGPTVVQGERPRNSRDYDEFLERSRRSMGGHFITQEQLAQRNPYVLSDALRATPGIRVVPTGGFSNAVLGRGNCPASIFVDGMPLMDGSDTVDQIVRPQDVAGIEVYGGNAIVPARFQGSGSSGCGVVAIWTKR